MKHTKLWRMLLLAWLIAACSRSATPATQPTAQNQSFDVLETFMANAPDAAGMQPISTPVAPPTPHSSAAVILPTVDPYILVGDIYIAGSPNLWELNYRMYDRFVDDGYAGVIKIESMLSSPAFTRFCDTGESDIAVVSRAMRQGELETCLKNGRTPIALPVSMDALVIVVNRQNTFLKDLARADIARLFTAEMWSEVNPDWPARPIQHLMPAPTSGTLSAFAEMVLAGDTQSLIHAARYRGFEDEFELIDTLQEEPEGLGVMSYITYLRRQDLVQIVTIDGFMPTATTVQSQQYTLSRPMYLYTAHSILQAKPQVSSFLSFYLTNVNDAVLQAGGFPLKPSLYERTKLQYLIGTQNEMQLNELHLRLATPTATQ